MSWIDASGTERRPLVIVEDHLYHTTEMLAALTRARPDLAAHTTVCAIDRSGPDTIATVRDWLRAYPDVQIAAPVSCADVDAGARARVTPIEARDTADAAAFSRFVARLLRPGGLLVQDVQLATLPFVPADRWWESIYVAATVRGLFAARPPAVRFLSNKRGYSATFGRELMDAGFDPRDVMDKADLGAVVVPTIAAAVDRHFPLKLRGRLGNAASRDWIAAGDEGERRDLEEAFDLLLWPTAHGADLGGRLVAGGRVSLKASSQETVTWRALIDDALEGGDGLPVVALGERIGPAGAERAELTNLAARHIHTVRGRLVDGDAVLTVNHTYRLRPARVGSTSHDLR